MIDFSAFDAHVQAHRDAWLAELVTAASQPSVSATGEGIDVMGPWVRDRLARAGATADLVQSGVSHPAVVGEIGSGQRTLLFYDHYDVQPPGDSSAWSTAPFQPTLRDGRLYGRGVADDKAELLARIFAVEAWRASIGDLPLRVRWLIEGAHEIGSPGLEQIVTDNRGRLTADACLSEGTGRDDTGNFTINLGCRGFVSLELRLTLRNRTLASMYGGLLPSAPRLLLDAVRSIVGPDGALTVDGVADRVQMNNPELLDMLGRIPWNEADIRASLGITEFAGGMTGLPLLRRYILEPFVAVCSITSGDPSWGLVIPGDATARLDVRLVPGLDPDDVVHLIREQLRARGFGDVSVTVLAAVAPDRIGSSEPIVVAAQQAAWDAEGRSPVMYPLMPAYSASRVFRNGLGTPVLFAGAPTNATSDLHAANENIVVDELFSYIRFLGRLFARFSAATA